MRNYILTLTIDREIKRDREFSAAHPTDEDAAVWARGILSKEEWRDAYMSHIFYYKLYKVRYVKQKPVAVSGPYDVRDRLAVWKPKEFRRRAADYRETKIDKFDFKNAAWMLEKKALFVFNNEGGVLEDGEIIYSWGKDREYGPFNNIWFRP